MKISERGRAWSGQPFWATALHSMQPAGQRFARGIWSLIQRSDSRRLWPGSGYRTTKATEHGLGRALDIICVESVGILARTRDPAGWAEMQALVALLIRYAEPLRIRHIIWDRRIYRTRYRAWGPLTGRFGVSDWHEDHAHVLLEPDSPGWLPILDTLTIGGTTPAPPTTTNRPAPSPEEDDIMATPAERQALISELLGTKLGRTEVTVMQALQETVTKAHRPGDVTVDLLGRMLGSSGPAVGTAIQGTYIATRRLEAQTAALAALIEAGGREGLDVAALSRIADEAAERALARLGEQLSA